MQQNLQMQIQKEVERQLKAGQFSFSKTNLHTHSGQGIDGPQIPFLNLKDTPKSYYQSTNVSFAGASVRVNSTATGLDFGNAGGTFAGSLGFAGNSIFLPFGWTCSRVTSGEYQIVHNLGLTNYAVVAIAASLGSPAADTTAADMIVINPNDFTIGWFNTTGSGVLVNTSFNFILHIQN